MALQHAYATTNLLSGLGVTSFTWSDASGNVANRSYLNDGLLYKQLTLGALVTGITLVIDLGSAQSASFFALLNHNLRLATPSGGNPSVKVEHSPDNISYTVAKAATNLYRSTGVSQPRDRDHVFQFDAISRRYWKITFGNWGGTFALSVGELFLGTQTTLSRFSQLGSIGDNEEYKVSTVELASGDVRAHLLAGPIREHLFKVDDLSATERDEVMRMWHASVGGAAVIAFINQYEAGAVAAPDDYQDVMLGRIRQKQYSWKEYDFARYSTGDLSIRSLGREMGA